ncbi:uncharacterized protein LOC132564967, partial [Ylistrum balloti]|uniref:uncharacterized protein LOC132564967 n=1 Tax=Ylistrum balloti TaxID=509963 RepID=UPI002905A36B
MDVQTSRVVDIQLVQSNEVKNSYNMELEGLKRCLKFLQEEGVDVSDLVTDRHSQVKKFMKTERPDINHWFDVWHVAKGVYKKLEALGKTKKYALVGQWARSISNHVYWCAASSHGDGELVRQKWKSITNHIADVHDGHGDRFPNCLHDDIERNWFKLCLAALHFNANSSRPQAVKNGKGQYRVSFPKSRKGDAVAKEIKVKQNFDYIEELMEEVVMRRQMFSSYGQAQRALAQEMERPPPSISWQHRMNMENYDRENV